MRRSAAIIAAAVGLGILLMGAFQEAGGEEETFGFRRGAFLDRAMGARPAGMGEAFTALADDVLAANFNPGGLGQLGTKQAIATYENSVGDLGSYYAAFGIPTSAGVAALSLVGLTYGSYDLRDISGREIGTESPVDVAVGVSYAFANSKLLNAAGWTGATLELVQESVGGMLAAVSVGGVIPFRSGFSVGWAVQRLGPAPDGFALPTAIKGGAAIRAAQEAVVCADMGYAFAKKSLWISVGGEAAISGVLVTRAGYRQDLQDQGLGPLAGLSLGGGLKAGRLGLDYAYLPHGELGSSHKMSLSYSFPPPAASLVITREEPEVMAEENYLAGLRYATAGDFDRALRRAKQAVENAPRHWRAWRLLGTCRYRKGDLSGAMAAFEESLKIKPDNVALKGFVASLSAGEGIPEAEFGADATAETAYNEAMEMYRAADFKQSWAKAYEALAADPNHWQSWQLIGSCQYALGDPEGALESFRWALEMNPDNGALKAWINQLENR